MVISFLAANGTQAAPSTLHASTIKEGMVVYDNTDDALKLCDGTNWIEVGSGGSGGIPAGNDGSIQFKAGANFAADAANLHWDDTNNRLGIGLATPATSLEIAGNVTATSNSSARTMLLRKGATGEAAVTLQSAANYGTFGLANGFPVITTSQYVNVDVAAQFRNGKAHFSDSTNVYGTGRANAEIAPGAAYPAIHTLARGVASSADQAFLVTSGPSWTTMQAAIKFDGSAYFGGSVGIGTSVPSASSLVEINSTTRGFLPPRMTTAQVDAIASPANGLIAYDTDLHVIKLRSNGAWVSLTSGSSGATPAGNDGSVQFKSGSNFAADADNFHWDDTNNRLGIGTATPLSPLVISANGSPLPDPAPLTGTLIHAGAADGTTARILLDTYGGATSATSNLTFRASGGTAALPTAMLTGHILGQVSFAGRGATAYSTARTTIRSIAAEDWTDAAQGAHMLFFTTGLGTVTNPERMRLTSEGVLAIGTAVPDGSSLIDISSTTKGFLPPRMTTAQVDAIATPADGLMAYDTDLDVIKLRANGTWISLGSGGGATPAGNDGSIQFKSGSNLAADTANLHWDDTNNRLGVGTTAPSQRLHVVGSALMESNLPQVHFREADASTDNKQWKLYPSNEEFVGTVTNDVDSAANVWLRVNRTGITVDNVSFPLGNIGIGTANPNSKLEVRDGTLAITSGSNNIGLLFAPEDQGAAYTNTPDERKLQLMLTGMSGGETTFGYKLSWRNADGSPRLDSMHFHKNGRIGINNSNPQSALHVGGGIQLANDADTCPGASNVKLGTLKYLSNVLSVCNSGGWSALSTTGGASSGTAGYVQLSNGSGAFASSSTSAGQQLLWDTTNHRLGIGTATPGYKLHVDGVGSSDVLVRQNTLKSIHMRVDGTHSYINNMDNFVGNGSSGNGSLIVTGQSGISFRYGNAGSSGTDAVRIDSTGNVGIGTANPTAKFSIKLASSAAGEGLRLDTETAGGYYDFYRAAGGLLAINGSQAGYAGYQFKSNDTDLVTFAPSGNVGIGITNPNHPLVVRGALTAAFTDGTNRTRISGNIIDATNEAESGGTNLILNPGGIFSGGYVGIGTTTPQTKLDFGGSGLTQTNAVIAARKGGNSFEFGHNNQSGYASTIGAEASTGAPFIAFNGEAGTTVNTYRTRGVQAAIIKSDNVGGLIFGNVAAASADNQTMTSLMTLGSTGGLGVQGGASIGGFDLSLGKADQVTRGDSGASRALVKGPSTELGINWNGDFPGGTRIKGAGNTDNLYVSAAANGSVGIGTTTPITLLEVAGSAAARGYRTRTGFSGSYGPNQFNINWSGANAQLWIDTTNIGNISISSDRRVKKDIEELTSASGLASIERLNPVSFHWKDPKAGTELQYGFIAQEMKEVLPELVRNTGMITPETPDGLMRIEYTGLIAPMIKAIKELKVANDNLKTENASLRSELRDTINSQDAEIELLRRDIEALKSAR